LKAISSLTVDCTCPVVSWLQLEAHELLPPQLEVAQQGHRPSPEGGMTRSPISALPAAMAEVTLAGTAQPPSW